MKVKELITALLGRVMDEEVFVENEDGLKKIRGVVSAKSETNPRKYVAILTEINPKPTE